MKKSNLNNFPFTKSYKENVNLIRMTLWCDTYFRAKDWGDDAAIDAHKWASDNVNIFDEAFGNGGKLCKDITAEKQCQRCRWGK